VPALSTVITQEDARVIAITEKAMLLEQARVLRRLAASFDHALIRHDLLRLAETCDELAKIASAPKGNRAPDG
jgi:hypothetical protein